MVWGSAPDPTTGAFSVPPDLLAGFKGPTSKGRREGGKGKGKRRAGEGGRDGEGREGREMEKGSEGIGERGGKENEDHPPTIFGLKVALL